VNHHIEEEPMSTIQATGQPARIAGLAADDYGHSDDRAPLILLHGLTFDRTTWRDIMPELQRIDPGRRVVALDLPGHGQSPDQPAYELDTIVEQIHEVVEEAGLSAPVLVGHSASGGFATAYAARHPSHGVVNIDSSLQIAPFITLLQSLGDRLRGPDFPALWQQIFYASFRVELLPPAAQDLVRATCRPRQQVTLGYWRQLIEQSADEVPAMIEHEAAALRASGMPYLYIAGDDLHPGYRQWLGARLPAATVEVWPRTGHFPHLADPQRFARRLADTAQWIAR
jgi:pimeloyl-ACP methyl ester carboxylesterase